MAAMSATIERHHRLIIAGLVFVVVFFVAGTFHDVIPVCHYLFGCDHAMH